MVRRPTHGAPRRWSLQPLLKDPHPPLDVAGGKHKDTKPKPRPFAPLVRDDIEGDVPEGSAGNRWAPRRVDNESWEAISRKWIGVEPPSWSRLQTLSVAESARRTGAHFRCANKNSPFPRRLRGVCVSDRRLQRDPGPSAPARKASHFGTDNFASKISASPPSKTQQCVCAPWKLTPSPKWLVVRPPRSGHVVWLLKGA